MPLALRDAGRPEASATQMQRNTIAATTHPKVERARIMIVPLFVDRSLRPGRG